MDHVLIDFVCQVTRIDKPVDHVFAHVEAPDDLEFRTKVVTEPSHAGIDLLALEDTHCRRKFRAKVQAWGGRPKFTPYEATGRSPLPLVRKYLAPMNLDAIIRQGDVQLDVALDRLYGSERNVSRGITVRSPFAERSTAGQ